MELNVGQRYVVDSKVGYPLPFIFPADVMATLPERSEERPPMGTWCSRWSGRRSSCSSSSATARMSMSMRAIVRTARAANGRDHSNKTK